MMRVEKKLKHQLAIFVRKKRGDLSVREYSKKIGLSKNTIFRIESEDHNVTISTLAHLCQVYRCSMGSLFNEQS